MAGGVVTLEQAKSGRSTCRASGEPIAKGDWRVGFETWISGRVAMAWMVRCAVLCCFGLPLLERAWHVRLRSWPEPLGPAEQRFKAPALQGWSQPFCITWHPCAQKPLPFLEGCCRVEYALSAGGSQGACKATGTAGWVRGQAGIAAVHHAGRAEPQSWGVGRWAGLHHGAALFLRFHMLANAELAVCLPLQATSLCGASHASC